MNFLHYDVWPQSGDVVQVSLSGNAANVLLMDESNFQNYKAGRQFQYYGGYFTQSPVIIKVPSAGHWKVVVDLGGRAGHVNAAVAVIRGRF
jgi:hypothetical protein